VLRARVLAFPGDNGGGATPVPIPNTEVKPSSADGTAWVTVWESRSSPGLHFRQPASNGGLSAFKVPLLALTVGPGGETASGRYISNGLPSRRRLSPGPHQPSGAKTELCR
jgi:hypothetical protein